MLLTGRRSWGTWVAVRDAARFVRAAAGRTAYVVIALQIITGVVLVAELVLIREVVDRLATLEPGAGLPVVLAPLVGFGALTALRSTAEATGRELQWAVAERTERFVSSDVLRVAATVPYEQLERADFRDRLARALDAARNRVWEVAYGTLAIGQSGIALVGLAVFLATVAPVLLPAFALAGLLVLLLGRRMGRARHAFEHADTAADRERRYLSQALASRSEGKEVRIFGSAEALLARHDTLWDRRLVALGALVRQRVGTALVANVATAAVLIASLAAVAWLTVRGDLAVADAAVTALTAQQLSQRIRALAAALTAVHDAGVFLADVPVFIREATAEASAQPPARPAPPHVTAIEARGATFTYEGQRHPAVRDVDVVLRPGEVVALVGHNGSGKSTLAKLLCGLHRPDRGEVVLVDGNGRATAMAELTGGRSAVFQDFAQYEMTARENVTLGDVARHDADEAFEEALRRASASGFVHALPDGPATRLGRSFADSVDLSLGQWQRLALARALFRDAPLLVLDEPTASLDAQAEIDLLTSLRRSAADRAVLLISHRYTTVRAADRVLVLHDGRVVEEGTPEALVAAGGLYADFVRLQS